MNNEKIRKTNPLYLLAFILAPIVIGGAVLAIDFLMLPQNIGPIVSILVFAAAVAWWSYGAKAILKKQQKKLEKQLDEQGFRRNQTFNSKGCVVIVDMNTGMMALLFTWNPFHPYILPASRISKVWVDDGRSGSGIMEGSSQVSFLFTIDGVTIRVYTFTSNKRWKMTDNYILTGISKADMMAEVLENARKRGA